MDGAPMELQGVPVQAVVMAVPVQATPVQAVAMPVQANSGYQANSVPVAYHQGQQMGAPVVIQRPPSDWSNGICQCCDHKDCGCTCCLATTCFNCCFYPSLEQTAGVRNGFGGWGTTCITLCGLPDALIAACGCPAVLGCIARYMLRRESVKHYNITENECLTCCCCCFCSPCATCQQTHEMMTQADLIFDGPFKAQPRLLNAPPPC